MTIYARFMYPHNGYDHDQEQVLKLKFGKKYKLRHAEVDDYHTTVYLEGYNEKFNSVHFSFVDENDNDINIYKIPEFSVHAYDRIKSTNGSSIKPVPNMHGHKGDIKEFLNVVHNTELELFEDLVLSLTSCLYGKQVLYKQRHGVWYNRELGENQSTLEMIGWVHTELCDSLDNRTF